MGHSPSQLSYEPICSIFGTSVSASCSPETHRFLRCFMDHSLSQLSYEPMFDFWNVCFFFLGTRKISDFCVALRATRSPS